MQACICKVEVASSNVRVDLEAAREDRSMHIFPQFLRLASQSVTFNRDGTDSASRNLQQHCSSMSYQ